MKIDEPDTPFHHYDSDGEHSHHSADANNATEGLCWNHLSNKLNAAAAAQEQLPPTSPGGSHADSDAEEERRKELKALEFKEHRKRHYNEMELVRKFRQQHASLDDEEDEEDED